MQTDYNDSFNNTTNSSQVGNSGQEGLVDYNPNSPTKSKSPTPTKEGNR